MNKGFRIRYTKNPKYKQNVTIEYEIGVSFILGLKLINKFWTLDKVCAPINFIETIVVFKYIRWHLNIYKIVKNKS